MKLVGLKIIRSLNFIFIFILTIFAYNISIGHLAINLEVLLAALSISLIAGAGNTLNDFFDYKIDVKNKPDRPIPSGHISRKEALLLSILLFAFGLTISSFVNSNVFMIALVATFGLIAYGVKGNYLAFSGNILIAFLTALVFVYGAFVASSVIPFSIYLIATAAFTINVSREIIKGIEDYDADSGIKLTLPQKIGKYPATLISMIFLIFNLIVVYGLFPIYFTGIVFLFSFPIIIFLVSKVVKILKNQNSTISKETQQILKLMMFIEFFFVVLDKFVINVTV